MTTEQMSLAEACAPLFLHLTTFRRNAATSTQGIQELHHQLRSRIDQVRATCEEDARLAPLFGRVDYALVATADQAVIHSKWPNRAGWQMNLLETHYFGRAEGGKKFFEILEQVLDDPTTESAELAEVLFTCLALGFEGMLGGERRELERKRRQLFDRARLADRVEGNLAPMAYGRNAVRENNRLPTVELFRTVAATVAAVVFWIVVTTATSSLETSEEREAIDAIIEDLRTEGNRG